jgi:hypothetical protein
VNDIVALYAGHIELEEVALAAGFFEGSTPSMTRSAARAAGAAIISVKWKAMRK